MAPRIAVRKCLAQFTVVPVMLQPFLAETVLSPLLQADLILLSELTTELRALRVNVVVVRGGLVK